MNSRIQNMWADALESDEYTQGRGALNIADEDKLDGFAAQEQGMCCLAVLCDLHRIETDGVDWIEKDGIATYLGSKMYLPKEVADWAGFTEDEVRSNECREEGECDVLFMGEATDSNKGLYRGSTYRASHLNDGEGGAGRVDGERETFKQIAARVREMKG